MTTAAVLETRGENLIGGEPSRAGEATFTAFDPRRGQPGEQRFHEATPEEVARAAALAGQAFRPWASVPPVERAALLRAIADALQAWREPLVALADQETALGRPRLQGELDRTTGQLRAFADALAEGSYVEAILSLAQPEAQPPRPDLRRMLVPVGPVAVFTPSNFPLAFGVAGGDTASALAAGCPVVVKGHPAHPATSEACARAILQAIRAAEAPAGLFSLLQGRTPETSRALVLAPEIQAVAFTGSLAAGRALHDLAATRPQPIPVYAEMGSLNPVFLGPAALRARGAEIAEGLAASITLGTGQFCTKPGLLFVPDDESGTAFLRALGERVAAREAGFMLGPGTLDTLRQQLERTRRLDGIDVVAAPRAVDGPGLACGASLLATDVDAYLAEPALAEEHFGPASIAVRCPPARMMEAAERLSGNLTATVHADPADQDWARSLAGVLQEKVGRIVWNGYPTGVAVVAAMQHGGPWPASTSAGHTSVGVTALRRFLRPVAFQNAPDVLLPEALRDANPLGIQRLRGGVWSREPVSRG
jgi:acyl-CoA reductase-like NAD-dependent aldehyde dehydrogenase